MKHEAVGRFTMPVSREDLENQLNDLRPERRKAAFEELLARVASSDIVMPEPGRAVNLHCHTAFSYNAYGYSPTYFAWKAWCEGLYAAGVVDFDVLDAADEFLSACAALGLRGCAGIETRAFVAPFETRVINSPGEPGITYHIGVGFTSSAVADGALLAELKETAQDRNRGILARVNPFLDPVMLDYDKDVLVLTPNGNATERHLCVAFDNKARAIFPDAERRAAFWAAKLGGDPGKIKAILDDAPSLQALIRSKTMKAGGVGYVKPSGPDFPAIERINAFILESGAIPVFGWLDGLNEGEQAIEELLGLMIEDGVAAVSIIPDRNWNIKDPEAKKTKLEKLYQFADLAHTHDLPLVIGTEMNAYGQRFVDDFNAPELEPLTDAFIEGALIVYAHTILQGHCGMGYLSPWARDHFLSAKEKNDFFREAGEIMDPFSVEIVDGIGPEMAPEEILCAIEEGLTA